MSLHPTRDLPDAAPVPGPGIYAQLCEPLLGRALSCLDAEATSPSRGSFDRTWWCWKFTDFSAPRFQEGIYTLGWLHSAADAPAQARDNARLVERAAAAITFWRRLQHADGSFDEAYPFERSLAATAFTGFYAGCGIERLRGSLASEPLGHGLQALERGAGWLSRNGEHHGILSNHLAAAAAALQIAGDVLGTDRFLAARDRFLGIIYAHYDRDEGWFREYGGADPGYQSHGMFYLAEIWRRTRNAELLERLKGACEFVSWFAHPDGTLGGEYASRGTKFAYPAAFEILAAESTAARAVAAHLRRSLARRRGVGAMQMDAWNMFPLLNNYLFAAEAATDIAAQALPWQQEAASRLFPRAGLAACRHGDHVLAIGLANGGALKMWSAASGALIYEDAGYAMRERGRFFSSQGESEWRSEEKVEGKSFVVAASFSGVPAARFDPWRFVAFRLFTLTVGRFPKLALWLKQRLVATLIRHKSPHRARLKRTISFEADGRLTISDTLSDLSGEAIPLERQVPFHMGSSRYADLFDWLGARMPCPPAIRASATSASRIVTIENDA